ELHGYAPQRKIVTASTNDRDPRRPATDVRRRLRRAVDATPRHVHAGNVGQQIGQRLDVREGERVGGEAVARAARGGAGRNRRGKHREIVRDGVGPRAVAAGGGIAGGGIAGGGVAPRRGVD